MATTRSLPRGIIQQHGTAKLTTGYTHQTASIRQHSKLQGKAPRARSPSIHQSPTRSFPFHTAAPGLAQLLQHSSTPKTPCCSTSHSVRLFSSTTNLSTERHSPHSLHG